VRPTSFPAKKVVVGVVAAVEEAGVAAPPAIGGAEVDASLGQERP
jgi:hypothetical protein